MSAAPADVRDPLATALLADGRSILLGPAAEAVDPEVERDRLRDELATAESELERAEAQAGRRRASSSGPRRTWWTAERDKAARYAAERDALGARIAALG